MNKEINIAQLMIPKVSTVILNENKSVRQGFEIFRHHGYTAVPVVNNDGEYLGCVTEGDFLRHIIKINTLDVKEYEKYKISDIFRKDFCRSIQIDASADEVIKVSLDQNFIPVTDSRGYFCGIITRRSLIVYLSENQ